MNLFIASLIASHSLPWEFKIDERKVFMVASAHDSQIFECRKDYAKELRDGITFTVENLPTMKYFGFKFSVPIRIDVSAYQSHWEGEEMKL